MVENVNGHSNVSHHRSRASFSSRQQTTTKQKYDEGRHHSSSCLLFLTGSIIVALLPSPRLLFTVRQKRLKSLTDELCAQAAGSAAASAALLPPSLHLTGPCWKTFREHVHSFPGWRAKHHAATVEEKIASSKAQKRRAERFLPLPRLIQCCVQAVPAPAVLSR